MLKYPSVQSTKGEGAQILIAKRKSKVEWFGKVNIGALTAFLRSQASEEIRCTLSWKEFMSFAFCLIWPISQMSECVDLILHWGGPLVLVGCLICSLGVAVPLLMLLLFLGSYSKKGYFTLWEMVPVLKGMAWSVSMLSISLELPNVASAGMASMYLEDLLSLEIPWKDCKFKEATPRCYEMYPKQPHTKPCCSKSCTPQLLSNRVYYSTIEYFLINKIRVPSTVNYHVGIGIFQGTWVLHVALGWCIIGALSSVGFKKFKGIMSTISLIFIMIFFIPVIGIATFVSSNYPMPIVMSSKFIDFFNPQFWVDILSFSLWRILPGTFVVIGSIAPPTLMPNVDVFSIYIIQFFFLILLMVCVSLGIQTVQIHYKVEDVRCIPLNGIAVLFAIIPDIMTRAPLAHVVLMLWFLGIWFHGLSSATYTVTAFLDSIIEAIPGIQKFRALFTALICTIFFSTNLIFLTSYYFVMEQVWVKVTFSIATITVFFLFGVAIFMYSVANFANDFHFSYGSILGNYWRHSLKLTVLLTSLGMIMLTQKFIIEANYTPNPTITIMCYIFLTILLMPIVISGIWNYMKYKNQQKVELSVTPTDNWGPPTAAQKLARSRFHPQREVHFKSEGQKCKHNCLLNSAELKKENKILHRNRRRLLNLGKNIQITDEHEEQEA